MRSGSSSFDTDTGPSVLFVDLDRFSTDQIQPRTQLVSEALRHRGMLVAAVSLSSRIRKDRQPRFGLSVVTRIIATLRGWRRTLSAVRRHDCIHLEFDLANHSVFSGLFLLAVSGYLGKRSVIALSTVHADRITGLRGLALGRMLRAASAVVVGSEEAERQLDRLNVKVKVVPMLALARESKTYSNSVQPRLALAAPVDPAILRSIIRGLALAKRKYPRSELAVIGNRDEIRTVKSHLAGMSLNGVELVSCENDRKVILALCSCDFYLESSPQADPTPALVEALALGMPIISIDTAGIANSITHGVSGLEVAAGDHVDLANRLCELVESIELVHILSTGALTLAKPHERSAVGAAWAQLYATISMSGYPTPEWPRRISPQYHTTVKA
ncbi:hypothetical protein C3F09_05215 [candidate division GN15 bacterium]|uniref:Glycosyltransferase n=1 Tax=candidate division GN15 bacterium TaxID=2072418 RepID=A0A855X787_9BACT|nr:MAG: hypothetical protein C3F09_05215 [candidate division GN15 bacterium]